VHKPCCIQTDGSFPACLTSLLPRVGLLATATIEQLLFFLSLSVLIVFNTAFCGASLPVGLPTAKWTSQILTAGIPRMGEKKNPAMPALGQALSQVGIFFEDFAKGPIIPDGNFTNFTCPVPVRVKLKKS